MPKFIKVEPIEAFQFLLDGDGNPIRWGPVLRDPGENQPFYIQTLEANRHIVTPGDWIATGVKGEHWAIKPDIFAATYKPIESTATVEGRK